MKKLMIAMMATIVAICAKATLTPESSEAEFRAALTEVLAQTNDVKMNEVYRSTGFAFIAHRKDLSGLLAEADAALAAKGFGSAVWMYPVLYPKASAIGRSKNGANTNLTYAISLAARLGCNITSYSFSRAGAAPDEIARVMGEYAVSGRYADVKGIEHFKTYLQQSATNGIKRRMREKGESFVTKDGVNPVERYLTRLNTALNAPRFAGLNEWLADLNYKERIDLSRLPAESEIAALKDAVIYGEKDMTLETKVLLYVCLGVDGYNAFVKEYNGDK